MKRREIGMFSPLLKRGNRKISPLLKRG